MNRPSSSREQAVLHTPGSNLVLVAGTVFALAGAGIVALGLGREDPREEALRTFLLVFGGVFLAAGSGLIVQRLRVMSRRVLVEHDEAADPDLEDAPILAEGSHTESTCAHLLVLEGEGGKLIPDPNVKRLRIAGLVAFGLALYAGMVAIFFGFRPLDDMVDEIQNSDLAHGVASGLALMPLAAGLGIIAYVMNRTLGSRITLRFGPQDWSIEHADVTIVSGSRAELIAVQALAARDQLMVESGGSTHRTIMDTLEVVLAWRADGEVRRAALFRSAGAFPRTVETASRLATALDVPFVFRGTAEDWATERARARRRRPRSKGSL
ncbi:MAG: hypothetical protein O2865_01280 [Planctomycetota bacterium]|nr:hypothetical protein [Planctomycetota bacterium]MDA1221880.1 hypothetical protein [Planctomycetota bacterium]